MESKLQIISGWYRGRKLSLPPHARPTQNKARIALFNMLATFPRPKTVWDAFAGSGAFGIECISRFDSNVVFTDLDTDTVRKNLGELSATADRADALAVAGKYGAAADLIFIDPPYDRPELGAALVRKISGNAIIIWEMEKTYQPEIPANMNILKDKTYGRARFLILQRT